LNPIIETADSAQVKPVSEFNMSQPFLAPSFVIPVVLIAAIPEELRDITLVASSSQPA